MSKLSILLTRSIYPEIAKAKVTQEPREFRKLALRTSLIAGASGALVVLISIFFGRQVLSLIAGEAFEQGWVVLVPLTIAASFDLASVAFEPVLHASGHAGKALAARLTGVAALAAGIGLLHGHGPEGIAWAVSIAASVVYLCMGAFSLIALRQTQGSLDARALADEIAYEDADERART